MLVVSAIIYSLLVHVTAGDVTEKDGINPVQKWGEFTPLNEKELAEVFEICGRTRTAPVATDKTMDLRHNKTATKGQFPWMVIFQDYKRRMNGIERGVCGGFLISKRHVLTAAHCFYKFGYSYGTCGKYKYRPPLRLSYGEIDIRVGTLHQGKGRSYKVAAGFVANFSCIGDIAGYNDIALLELDEDISQEMIDDYRARPVCLGRPDRPLNPEKDELTVMGWGLAPIGSSIELSNVLRYTTVSKLEDEKCTRLKSNDKLCTKEDIGNVCQGDSGGPLVHRMRGCHFSYEAMGLVSYGRNCTEFWIHHQMGILDKHVWDDHGGIFTDIRKHLPMIQELTGIKPRPIKTETEVQNCIQQRCC